jgi:RTX calcium-binding nonapeptide repeat (4 copies)
MSRFTRAILGAAVLAVALPGAANAATLEVFDSRTGVPNTFKYRAAPGETNNVRVSETADGSMIVSDSAPIRISGDSTLDGCRLEATGDAVCAPNVAPFELDLGDGNDVIRYLASEPVLSGIDGGAGNDTISAGVRRNASGVLDISGGAGTADKVTYASATFPATVSLDGQGNDGVRGDANNVKADIEIVEGTAGADTITGSDADHRERFIGGPGNDTITGLGGSDVFHEGSAPNGADSYNGGAGIDLVDYSQRTNRVDVSLDLARNDGQAGEGDLVEPNVNDVFGGSAGDVISGTSGPNALIGNGGIDTLTGLGGDDRLNGGTGVDNLFGGDDNDVIESVDNGPDRIRCGEGEEDTLNRDLQDVDASDCEVVNSVGTLALTPKALAAEAGENAKLRLSWTHPQSWRKLRKVTLRLRLREQVVGRIAIRPRSERISGRGVVEVVRKHSRLTRKGKTVTARLALRLDKSLAGKTLTAEVEATDTRGRRQLERDAATVRVAG